MSTNIYDEINKTHKERENKVWDILKNNPDQLDEFKRLKKICGIARLQKMSLKKFSYIMTIALIKRDGI